MTLTPTSGYYNPQVINIIFGNIRKYLINAVHKRCSTTDRPIACLLSGGLDSSLIVSIAARKLGKI